MYTYELVCTSMYIPACTVLSDTELPVSGYYMAQGGTMKYPKVPLVYAGTCRYLLYIPACTALSDTELSVSGYNIVQGGTMQCPKVPLVYSGTCWYIPVNTGIYQHVLCFQTLNFLWNPLVDTTLYKAVHCSMRMVPKCPVHLNETVQGSTWQFKAGMCRYGLVCASMYQSRSGFKNGANQVWTSELLHTCHTTALQEYRNQTQDMYYVTIQKFVKMHSVYVPAHALGSWWRINSACPAPPAPPAMTSTAWIWIGISL